MKGSASQPLHPVYDQISSFSLLIGLLLPFFAHAQETGITTLADGPGGTFYRFRERRRRVSKRRRAAHDGENLEPAAWL